MFKDFRQLDARAMLLIVGSFLTSIAVYMSIPFLSTILLDYPGMTPTRIGVIIGVSHLCAILFGFIGGSIADRMGRSQMLIMSLFGFVVVFAGFAIAQRPLAFFALNALNGLCQSLFRPASEALLSDVTPVTMRGRVFGYRYTAANLGYTLGPVLGALFTRLPRGFSFMASAAIFGLYWVAFTVMLRRGAAEHTGRQHRLPFKDVLQIVRRDQRMNVHIVGGVLITLCFSQITSTFAQFSKLELSQGVWLYSTVLMLNTVLVVVLQPPVSRILHDVEPMKTIMYGCGLYMVGFAMLGMAALSITWALLGIVVITLGEVMIVPTGSTLVDTLAPEPLKAAYFGAAQLRFAGMFIGPIVGGVLYEWCGGERMFLVVAGLSLCAGLIYFYGLRASALIPKHSGG